MSFEGDVDPGEVVPVQLGQPGERQLAGADIAPVAEEPKQGAARLDEKCA